MTLIDTAQVYRSGKNEGILGDFINYHSPGVNCSKIIVKTKWLLNITGQTTNLFHPLDAPVKKLRKTPNRMNLTYVDCYLCHGPIHISSNKQVAEGLAKCVEQGMARVVGVANYSVGDMLKMKDALAEYNVPLATDQCEYSILRHMPEKEGMLEACKANDIIFQSYSSLGQGRLSGKYSKENPPPEEHRFSIYDMEHIEPVLTVLRELATKYNVSVAVVAIN